MANNNSDTNIEVGFGANTGELEAGAQKAAQSVQDATAKIKAGCETLSVSAKAETEKAVLSFQTMGTQIKGISEQISTAISGMTGMLAVFAGGAVFAATIKAFEDEVGQARQLMNTFGMTAEKASILNTQLKLVGLTSEDYTGMAQKLGRQVKQNEQGLNDLGVKTKDVNGNYLDQQTIMKNATDVMMSYKAGTDRNQVSMLLWGRNSQDAIKLQKLNNESMEKATELAQKLGLVLSGEAMQASKEYKAEMNATKIVVEGFMAKIGESLIPLLTKLGQLFVQIGQELFPIFTAAIDVSKTAVDGLGTIIKTFTDNTIKLFHDLTGESHKAFAKDMPDDMWSWKNVVEMVGDAVEGIFSTIDRALIELFGDIRMVTLAWSTMWAAYGQAVSGNFTGAMDSVKQGYKEEQKVIKETEQALKDQEAAQLSSAAKRAAAERGVAKEREAANNGKTYDGESGKRKKTGKTKGDGEASYIEQLTADLDKQKLEYEQYYASIGQIREVSKQQEANYWKGALDQTGLTEKERLDIYTRYAKLQLQVDKQALKDKEERGKAEIEIERTTQDGIIALEEESARHANALNLTSKEEYLSQEKSFLTKKYDIDAAALQKEIDLYKGDPNSEKKVEQLNQKLISLKTKYALDYQKADNKQVEDSKMKWTDLFKSISDGFGKSIGGFIVGTKNFQSAMLGVWQGIQGAFETMIGNMIAKWTAGELAKLAVTLGILPAQSAGEAAASATSIATKKAEAAMTIPASAGIAAGEAAASVAGIPYVGPEMAAAAYASTMAMVMSGLAVASASGGYDIPAGINPITQLHQSEMVLPAKYADVIRGMAGSSSPAGATTSGGDIHLHVNAVDAHSVRRLFQDNGSALADSLKHQMRNLKR